MHLFCNNNRLLESSLKCMAIVSSLISSVNIHNIVSRKLSIKARPAKLLVDSLIGCVEYIYIDNWMRGIYDVSIYIYYLYK